ncbi:holo-ACP synthase [Bombilactobacillus folatiphilus]|uniref:Holo-[acyl-carrier-protein] synthase n=1 Tax=Bombilactobacillus folatiphilus TaxID=2923362 RepID=A0ABY4P9M6_9LACO|nr:holo-ACP synthase [Bombilactobacillus folatiphilus]UQS82320.1 holo-ACP synthase [Bombilactobacillus folatiphilus]
MIQGLGVDLAEIERIWATYQKRPRFLTKVLTPSEQAVFQSYQGQRQKEFLAGRFSAKEAFSKALGTGIGPISFQDVSILNLDHGKPYVQQQVYAGNVLISISHTQLYVMTEVILEGGSPSAAFNSSSNSHSN